MRSLFTISLIITLTFSGSYFYYTWAAICQVPIDYRIGHFDERFDISLEEAKEAVEQATLVWENSTGRNLFNYNEKAKFAVNFVFDDRQERSVTEEAWRRSLDEKQRAGERLGEQHAALNANYNNLQILYADRVETYERRLNRFNATVAQYNQEGGAPAEVFEELKAEEQSLAREARELQSLTRQLENLVSELNELSERGNVMIEQYNAGVQTYNRTFGETNEFTQGDFKRDNINIYKFTDRTELINVLAHEFGHALDIGHVEGESSIMYYLMEAQPNEPELSPEDLAAFMEVCGDGTGLGAWLKGIIAKF